MRILFLNQYFPPDPAPTGVLFAELGERLREARHEIEFLSSGHGYRVGQGKGGRMRREATALLQILRAGVLARRPDVVISGSSPPCLLVAATLIAARHRAASLHWAMDLYPELAVTLGELRPGAVPGAIGSLTNWCYRRTDRVVALDDDMAAHLSRIGIDPAVIRPWVFKPVLQQLAALRPTEIGMEPRWTWIYSGNLGRAHEWRTLLDAQTLIEQSTPAICLRFQGGGPSWQAAQAYAQELGVKNCEWHPYVDEAELPASLLRCQACVVTQRPEAKGLLWPSKLGLTLSLPRPIVWVGPPDGAIAKQLRDLPHAGVFAPGQAQELAAWLLSRAQNPAPVPSERIFAPSTHREEALRAWEGLVADASKRRAF